jgi:hypothetical protein
VFFLGGGLALAQDQTEPSDVEVTLHIFSGLPDPVMKLEKSEIREYYRLLNQFKVPQLRKEESIPIYAQYRGLGIKEFGLDHAAQTNRLLYGDRELDYSPTQDVRGGVLYRSKRIGPDDSLERYLINLARDKGAIREHVYQAIVDDIDAREKGN